MQEHAGGKRKEREREEKSNAIKKKVELVLFLTTGQYFFLRF